MAVKQDILSRAHLADRYNALIRYALQRGEGKIEDPSGRDFSAKEKQGEVVVTLGLMW